MQKYTNHHLFKERVKENTVNAEISQLSSYRSQQLASWLLDRIYELNKLNRPDGAAGVQQWHFYLHIMCYIDYLFQCFRGIINYRFL